MPFSREVENLIAAWRGFPPDKSKSKLRDARPIGALVNGVLEQHRIGMPTVEETILSHWPEVVGSANAAYSGLMKIENNRRVYVAVTNPIVRQELFFHRKMILERIRALPGCSHLRELTLRAG